MAGKVTRARAVVLGIATVVAVLAAACGGSSGSASNNGGTTDQTAASVLVDDGTPVSGGKLVFGLTAETNGWNPSTAQWADAASFAAASMFEPFFALDANANLVPWLATSVTPNDNEDRSWTITLRKGVKFQDGTEMKAQAAVDSFNAITKDGIAAVAYSGLIKDAVVVDDYTFRVDMSVRWASFPYALASGMVVMAPSMMAMPDKGASNPIGTGAYRFESWTPDQSLDVKRFDDYWGGPCVDPNPDQAETDFCAQIGVPLGQKIGPWLDAMEFRPIVDGQQRANALEAGDLDIMLTTRPGDVASLRQGGYQVITDYDSEKTMIMTNTGQAPFNNLHARLALAYATNRQALLDTFSAGEPLVSDTSPFSESSKWGGQAPDQTGYPMYDPEKAKAEIEQYKADTGESSLSFTLSGLANTDDLQIMQAVQDQWAQVGINAQIDTLEQTAYILKIAQGDFQAAYFRNYAYPDPDADYFFFAKSGTEGALKLNFTEFSDDETENAVMWGRTNRDFAARLDGYHRLAAERNKNAVDIWLFDTPYALVAQPRVKGLNAFRAIPFGNFIMKPWVSGMWLDSSSTGT